MVQCISLKKVKQNWGKIRIVVFEKMKHFHLIEKFIPSPVGVDQSISLINLVVDDGLSDALNLLLDLSLCHTSALDGGCLV